MAHYRIERATEFIEAAEVLIEAGLPNAAISRVYYAVYHLMVLCLVRFGKLREADAKDWKHKTVVNVFTKTFCQRGFLFNANDAEIANQLWRDREDADYHDRVVRTQYAVRSVGAARVLYAKMMEELGGSV